MGRRKTVLALDLASGGASAVLINPDLTTLETHEVSWTFQENVEGAATLSAELVLDSV